ncbi:mitochondrial heat shock protein Hsp10 [Mycoemilia scoparia]|uniref:Mitochondrial heat shock protein Hsp10 n=1 Tax=Mycoemilia scoparia TaxID=417184 RepID=A0A9W7ZYR4_9FUNG|nr:mitochondrial heat shock protein Hsp10 [Mycoemilia scoparia]
MSARATIKKIAPLLDRVLVQRAKAETKTASGIFLPEKAVEKLNEGVVVAVGPGNITKDGKRLPVELAEGDRVLLPSYGGTSVKVSEDDEAEVLLFRESEILAKISQ